MQRRSAAAHAAASGNGTTATTPTAAPFAYLSNPPSSAPLRAYLVEGGASTTVEDVEDVAVVRELVARLHNQQFPPPESCAHRRLLVTQFALDSLEGIGSILKLLMIGLAQAAYGNRTLVWGLDQSPIFEYTRSLWQDGRPGGKPVWPGAGVDNCDWGGGGGAYGCFFERISSCTLADVRWSELTALGEDGHDDAARVRLIEARRSPVTYYPPPRLLAALAAGGLPAAAVRRSPGHKWGAAIAAYTFRLRPSVLATFEARRAATRPAWPRPLLGLQVRHGDVLAMPDVYNNRRSYGFEAYFQAAANRAYPRVPPALVFVASDNPDTGEVVAAEAARGAKRWAGRTGGEPPEWYTAPPGSRYRTPHGSHTVGTDGACTVRGTCGMRYEDMQQYSKLPEHGDVPRPERSMRVLAESIEDLYLMALADDVITTANSHYSSMAALLSWARTGAAHVERSVFVDEEEIASGELQNAFLHGAYNGTSPIPPHRAHERWQSMHNRFVESLPLTVITPRNLTRGLHAEAGLPVMPRRILYRETARWLGDTSILPIWPGECPRPRTRRGTAREHISELINVGAEHHEAFHYHQAGNCWRQAAHVLATVRARSASTFTADAAFTYTDVITGNLKAAAHAVMQPYVAAPENLAYFIQLNVALPTNATLRWPASVTPAPIVWKPKTVAQGGMPVATGGGGRR